MVYTDALLGTAQQKTPNSAQHGSETTGVMAEQVGPTLQVHCKGSPCSAEELLIVWSCSHLASVAAVVAATLETTGKAAGNACAVAAAAAGYAPVVAADSLWCA